ncbi:prosolanapyrone-II oxidase [Microdochium nivale]|nr:prosolanapyrone-II oxidase [Microdochium nivale]
MPLWSDAAYDDQVYTAAQKWHSQVQAYTDSRGKAHRFEFANYAAKFQSVIASYGSQNLEFLRTVSRKYDPKQIFQRSATGGYKLGI